MPRAKKGQQKVPILKKTRGLAPLHGGYFSSGDLPYLKCRLFSYRLHPREFSIEFFKKFVVQCWHGVLLKKFTSLLDTKGQCHEGFYQTTFFYRESNPSGPLGNWLNYFKCWLRFRYSFSLQQFIFRWHEGGWFSP